MSASNRAKAIIFAILAIALSMYQETPAQKRGVKTKPASTAVASPDIAYTISMSKPWTHLLEVRMNVKWQQMPDKAELKMPVWTPGSYLVREYARHVQDLDVQDGSGKQLT